MTGRKLQRWRTTAGVSQEELARTLKVAVMTVYRWEKRDQLTPKMQRQLAKAAKALNLPLR